MMKSTATLEPENSEPDATVQQDVVQKVVRMKNVPPILLEIYNEKRNPFRVFGSLSCQHPELIGILPRARAAIANSIKASMISKTLFGCRYILFFTVVLFVGCQTDPYHDIDNSVRQAYKEGRISKSELNDWNCLYSRERDKLVLANMIGVMPTDYLYDKWVGWGRDTTKIKYFLVQKEPRLLSLYFTSEVPQDSGSQSAPRVWSYSNSRASFENSNISSDSSRASYATSAIPSGRSDASFAGSFVHDSRSNLSYTGSNVPNSGSTSPFTNSISPNGDSRSSHAASGIPSDSSARSFQSSTVSGAGSVSGAESNSSPGVSRASFTSSHSQSPDTVRGEGSKIPGADIPWKFAEKQIANHEMIKQATGPVFSRLWTEMEKFVVNVGAKELTGGAYGWYKKLKWVDSISKPLESNAITGAR